MQFRKVITSLVAMVLVSLPCLAAQGGADSVSGKYVGLAKSQALGDIPITVQLKNANGKLSGSLDTPQGALPITDGTYSADGKISLKFDAGGNEGTVTAQLKDGKITGEWGLAGQTGTLDLKKEGAGDAKPAAPEAKPATPNPAAAEPAKPAAGDVVSGEWDCAAEVQGQSFPFTLKLKLDGDKITGESSSEQGSTAISKGTWAGNKMTIVLETPNGNITLNATVNEGKLTGDFDFAGQFQGKWDGKKK